MTNADLLRMMRRRLRDVDDSAQTFDDETLWGYVADRAMLFKTRKTAGFQSYAVSDSGVSPEPTDAHGTMLAVGAAALLLHDLYIEKVRSGTIGVTWESGLERESTIDVRQAYEAGIRKLEQEVEELILIGASATFATRPQ